MSSQIVKTVNKSTKPMRKIAKLPYKVLDAPSL